jgi:hypothetical protein
MLFAIFQVMFGPDPRGRLSPAHTTGGSYERPQAVPPHHGDARQEAIPLRFVRLEPYVVPKVSLTGINVERVDTRVVQVIYAVEGWRPEGIRAAAPGGPTRGRVHRHAAE